METEKSKTYEDLEEKVWNSRLGYAIEAFAHVNREYNKIWDDLAKHDKELDRIIGVISKYVTWPFWSTLGFFLSPPIYMMEVKYSKEKLGYVLKDSEKASINFELEENEN